MELVSHRQEFAEFAEPHGAGAIEPPPRIDHTESPSTSRCICGLGLGTIVCSHFRVSRMFGVSSDAQPEGSLARDALVQRSGASRQASRRATNHDSDKEGRHWGEETRGGMNRAGSPDATCTCRAVLADGENRDPNERGLGHLKRTEQESSDAGTGSFGDSWSFVALPWQNERVCRRL